MSFLKQNCDDQKIEAEEELKFISMADDLEERFSPDKKKNNLWEIQPWQNEQQSPSHSPQRRIYIPRPSPPHLKNDKFQILQKNTIRSKKVLQANNHCNFSIKVRSTSQKKNSLLGLHPIECENSRPVTMKRLSQTKRKCSFSERNKNGTIDSYNDEGDQGFYSFKEPVNMIVYPLINQNKKKRLFKKMQRFTNFVSMSLRK